MAGNKEGAAKARATMEEKYGKDWAHNRSVKAAATAKLRHGDDIHSINGTEGGKKGGPISGGNFKNNPARASEAGRISTRKRYEASTENSSQTDDNNLQGEQ
jgi:hypothetical protein